MNIIKEFENSLILDINNKQTLGLSTGVTNRSTAGTDFSEIRKNSGYILKDNNFTEFKLPEITEIDDKIVLYSKDLECIIKPLFSNNDNDNIQTIKEILRFFTLLKDSGIKPSTYAANLIYKTNDGELLMMPPAIVHFINERVSLPKKLSDLSIYRHPDLKDENSLLYSMGILLFQHTTDNYPIIYRDVEDLRDKMRRKKIVQPRWENIRLSDDLCKLINDLLDIDIEIDLKTTLKRLELLIKNGIYREDGDFENENKQNLELKRKMLLSETRRAILIKHRTLIIGITLGSIMLITIFGTMISNALKPPQTAGFSSQQVIETYFASFQTLDPELIDDVLAKGVRKGDSTEISTLYVTTKMRAQTDPTARMIPPKEWLTYDDEKKSNSSVYGIYNIDITPLDENRYNVSYEKWYTQPASDDISIEYVAEIHRLIRTEIFTMEKTKYSYEIINIETLTEKSEKVW